MYINNDNNLYSSHSLVITNLIMNKLTSAGLLFCVVSLVLIDNTLSLKCIASACETVDCRPITECGPGEVKARGGRCLCCDVCKKIVGTCEHNVIISFLTEQLYY